MVKLLATTLVISLSSVAIGFAQAQPSQSLSGQQTQPSRTAGAQPSHTASSAKVQLYKTEVDAKSHCGSDEVLWANTSSHALHDPGTKYYGKTKHGGYVCKGMATSAGYHESKQ
jgi:hypothetical protein